MRYVHTNIIAADWKRLARFYQEAFGCTPVPPERDISGDWIDRSTGIPGARIRGAHLLLPGWGEGGPTLEIFQYEPAGTRGGNGAPNMQGFTHIAFLVEDVKEVADRCMALGATAVGERVTSTYANGRTLIFQYLRDPEGNMLELQTWLEPGQDA